MLFKRKAFFLDLSDTAQGDPQPAAVVAVAAPSVEAPAAQAPVAVTPAVTAEAPQKTAAATPSLTTAEAIAAELAAAEASRPPASMATFAPECLTPGGAQPQPRRRGGANLSGFRTMAKGMMGKSL